MSTRKMEKDIELGETKESEEPFIPQTKNLEKKKKRVKSLLDEMRTNQQDHCFYGLRAPDEVIEEKLRKVYDDSEDVQKSVIPGNQALLTEYYYILVGKKEKEKEQEAFISKLEAKKIEVRRIERDGKMFYGLRAQEEVFEEYQYLLKVSDTCNTEDVKRSITLATRIRIVHFILHQTQRNTKDGLEELMTRDVFETKYCLHEENGQRELKAWARWRAAFNNQPFQKIQKYFGEKVALYYLWLGWYTTFLVPAAVLGVVVFLCGIAFFNSNPLIKEVCESNITMCPRCERRCHPWKLSDTCDYAKVSYLFDNKATVVFAMFMAVWATTFLELWKRHRAKHVSKWKVFDWCEEEEELILEIVNDSDCKPKVFKHSYLRSIAVLVVGTIMVLVIIGLAHALVVFRVVANPLLSDSRWEFIRDNANTVAVMLGAVAHYITIQIMTVVSICSAQTFLTFMSPNSRYDKEKSFTIMMFTFQFLTLFSSLFYVAFFLGRINGHPGNYVRIAGHRLEECHPSGCLTDLFIQMAVIMTLSQGINSIAEITKPWLKKKLSKVMTKKVITCRHKITIPWLKKNWWKKDPDEGENTDVCSKKNVDCWVKPCDYCLFKDWRKNHQLADTDGFSLFHEILEMVIQFSFITLFVAAFPLAPFMALINNIFEIRLDAIKMVQLERRLIPKKTNSIGVWANVLETIGVLAAISNGLVIGITSDFIPRLVYYYFYGPCAMGMTDTHCMSGYIKSTLTTAYMKNSNPDTFVLPQQKHLFNVTACSFRDFRSEEDHSLTSHFWLVLAARLGFVIVFEHLLLAFKAIAAWFFPSDSLTVKNDRLEKKLDRLKEELKGRKHPLQ
ncbi:Anoctamin-9 [Oryzias melastigma]|uniref:Anoctamin n=1 Tax=Oryzias melastigma TaxID=30732 RepID=A0A834FIB9_ORYME|nr:Anoctamin-9 [Oryzias melastigma]